MPCGILFILVLKAFAYHNCWQLDGAVPEIWKKKHNNNIKKYLYTKEILTPFYFNNFLSTLHFRTDSPTHDLNEGLYTSTLELEWQLSREDLASDIECRVESAAIKNAIVTKFSVDLQGESSLR